MKPTDNTISEQGHLEPRRQFIQASAGTGLGLIGLAVAGNAEGASKSPDDFKPFGKETRIAIGPQRTEILETAYRLGFEYEKEHRGCARCTVAAIQDALGFLPADDDLFRAASCLDGGATPTKLANCGGFTGSGMVIGWLCGTGRFGDNAFSHELIHKLHEKFIDKYGSVICRKVRESSNADCPDVVGNVARWTAEILLDQFTQTG